MSPEAMKLLGGVLMLAACAADGAVRYIADKRSMDTVVGYIELMKYIRMQIDLYLTPLDGIFAKMPTEMLEKCGYHEKKRPRGLRELVIDGCVCRRELEGAVRELGRGYREEELKLCDGCIFLLAEKLEKMKRELPNERRTRTVLELSAASALILLVI